MHLFMDSSITSFCWTLLANLRLIKRQVKAHETHTNPWCNSTCRALKSLFSTFCVKRHKIHWQQGKTELHPSNQHWRHTPSRPLVAASNSMKRLCSVQLCNPRTQISKRSSVNKSIQLICLANIIGLN